MKNTITIIHKDENFHVCYIPKHDMYFSSLKEKGKDEIYRKAKAMITAKENFLKEFPEYKK